MGDGKTAEILVIAIYPDFENQGIGKKINDPDSRPALDIWSRPPLAVVKS